MSEFKRTSSIITFFFFKKCSDAKAISKKFKRSNPCSTASYWLSLWTKQQLISSTARRPGRVKGRRDWGQGRVISVRRAAAFKIWSTKQTTCEFLHQDWEKKCLIVFNFSVRKCNLTNQNVPSTTEDKYNRLQIISV